ncbi:hypothetical protein SAMN05421594_4237 [Chryseobacterium oleae]|uniref:Uncharacterized protein n=1 Tax=Chryseobacterium oleae TaxID=491207 RepID=A0A1I5BWJ6_CHROL|nr:hypothetical protein SAMN05421594_4237 [Chryseobacterium oleae]
MLLGMLRGESIKIDSMKRVKTFAYSVTQSHFFAFLETYIFSIKALRLKML